MERTENDGNLLPVTALKTLGQVGQIVQPRIEQDVGLAAVFQDFRRHLFAGIVPGIPAGERVVQVHAGHDHHAAVIGLFDRAQFDGIFIQSLERDLAAVHEGRHVHREHAGIIPAHVLGVGSALGILPLAPVDKVVLMAEDPALLPDGPQVGIQGLGLGSGVGIGQCQCHRLIGHVRARRTVLPAGKEQGDGCEQQHDGQVSHRYSAGTCFWNTITYSSGLFTKRS